MMDRRRAIQIFILLFLLAWYGFFLAHKIDLTTVDLGRHLKNGQLILKGDFGILKSNFYSYTQPAYPVVNHHWGGGLIFFLIEKVTGFTGLSLFYGLISLIVFFLFFHLAQKQADFRITALVALLLIPLMASRTEIRPEIFTYLLAGLFFWILWHYQRGQLTGKWLLFLPLLEIIWVNTHIYFILGPALIGLFLLEKLIKARRLASIKQLAVVLGLTSLAAFVNPFGLKGVLYPFNIFREYGYRIIENQSVWFLENLEIIYNPNLALFKIAFVILVLSFVWPLIKNRRSFSISYIGLALLWSIMSWLAIRNFTLFGFFALPIISYNISQGLQLKKRKKEAVKSLVIVFLALSVLLITFFTQYQRLPLGQGEFGFGLLEGNNQSAQFFKEQNIQGPVLNNYDIGGYLIYHLYPQEKVFTDNRPEAYSVSFFKDIYIPLQQNESIWQEQSQKHNFNVIFFGHRDATPWGQQFLVSRLKDPFWAVVWLDQYAIIFLKRNELNQSIIERYEIPANYFRIIK